ncbi:neprilysin-1 isoform X2 [Parasteatoda tepidariorum]|uniref:neprilysin-1 isoform X2 n=1 Tax=Parasteatoda tepidariorum TaxID=114398 RepID=UPI001C71D76E|nr:neprilysin-1 isoform X2 [Parasteatoda tepidariorum]
MKMVLKGSPNQADNLPEYEMLANGNAGKKEDSKKTMVRIQENPLAEVTVEKSPLPQTEMVQLKIEKGRTRCVSRSRHRFRTTFELVLSLTTLLLGLLCCILFYMIFLQAEQPSLNICLTEECVKTAASLLNAMDQSSDPCEDFFQYACGTWNKLHMIPQDRSSISTFEVMADDLQVILKGLLEEPANNYDNSATIKAKTFYKSCISQVQIDAIGDKPLRDVVKELGGWPVSERDWVEPEWPLEHLLGQLRGDYNQGIIIEQWVGPDDKNSSVNVIQLDQMSFGLPSREYFLKDSSEKERKAYLKLMVEVAILFGADREIAEMDMTDVLDLEIRFANSSTPEADRHDTGAIYNKMSLQELSEIVPEFDWVYYLNTFLPTKVDDQEPVVVYALPYLQEMGQIISQVNRRTVHNYAIWRMIKHMLPFLDGEYSQKRTEFKKVLLGISAERERWNQCVDLVNKKMGMAVGALFIRDNFDPKSKETAQEMILNIREAFNELLEENAWMDKDTREVAREKANAMNERIGYPDLLTKPIELSKEYEGLTIHDDLFLVNILNVFEFEASKNLKKLRQPVNKDRWTTEPAVVNAFYNPNKNDIVFPAGILQPLFYSHHFPKSLNYGGIGVVIGHEMTHGFDDKGRQFDKEGNLKQWWNEATVRRFRERAQCIIDQYSSYVLEDIGHNINGKMTQGENIADNGGLKQAYRAYKKYVSRHGEEPLLPGLNLTHDQLFFLNYAQIWCGSMRPEDALSKVRSSVHSPGPIRVLGPLSNSYDFAKTYSCPMGSRMNPKKKCSVW